MKTQGKVKWFSDSKGYGFIAYPGNEEPGAYVHFSEIKCEGFKTLYENQNVTFEIENDPRGATAKNVVKIQ